ncbi:MAG: CDGSH iron-sulfur domain-containing protein [Rhodospirillaceae bacterium]
MSESTLPTTLPRCAQKGPYEVEVEAGEKVFWCTCGLSAKQPKCDGAHKGTGFKPHISAAEKTEKVWLCGCKATKTPPFCDGSHNGL